MVLENPHKLFKLLSPDIKNAVIKSQHCQRNWNLSQKIADEDIELFKSAVTLCPSKQNHCFYEVSFIQNRQLIESIHENTVGFGVPVDSEMIYTTNPQTLANLLVVFEYSRKIMLGTYDEWKRDADMSIGIASGYLNLISTMLNYKTGYCACFDSNQIKSILNTENDIALMIGIGIGDDSKERTLHHNNADFNFPAFKKQDIKINVYI